MANTLASFGFRFVKSLLTNSPNYQLTERRIAYDNSNTIGYGDPVKLLNTGYLDLMAAGGSTIDGIFLGCQYPDSTAIGGYRWINQWNAPSLASTAEVKAFVITDPFALFQVQVNGTAMAQTNIGNNIDITAASSGNPNAAGFSQCSLDAATADTTATYPFRIVDIVYPPAFNATYSATAANNIVVVRMNTSDQLNTTGI